METLPTASERWPLLTADNDSEITLLHTNDDSTTDFLSTGKGDLSEVPPEPEKITFKVIAVAFCWLCSGIAVTAVGALLDYIKVYYQIDNTTASFIFPASIFGYISGALSLSFVVSRLGWRGIGIVSPTYLVIATTILSSGPPFPVMLVGYAMVGMAYGLSDTGYNTWATRQRQPNIVQGYLHSSYAVGCILGPIATLVVTSNHLQWYNFYWGILALAILELSSLTLAFRKDASDPDAGTKTEDEDPNESRLKAVKLVACCCAFYFIYLAVESAFTNWIELFMKSVRHVNQTKAALSSSIFWAGVAIGRAGLGPITERFGTGTAICAYIFTAVCSQFVFSISTNTIASLVLLGISGVFMGPMFPSAIILMGQKLPNKEALVAVSVSISIGQIGSAISPLFIGYMADRFGLNHLPEVLVGLIIALLLIWMVFARMR